MNNEFVFYLPRLDRIVSVDTLPISAYALTGYDTLYGEYDFIFLGEL